MLRTRCEHQLSPLCFMTVRAVCPAFPCPCSHAFPSVSGNPEYALLFSRCFVGYCVRTPRKEMNTTRVLPLPGLLSPSNLLMASYLSQLSWLERAPPSLPVVLCCNVPRDCFFLSPLPQCTLIHHYNAPFDASSQLPQS